MTRARQHLHLIQPMRMFRSHQHRHGDGHILTMRSRFIPDSMLQAFERRPHGTSSDRLVTITSLGQIDVAAGMREMWNWTSTQQRLARRTKRPLSSYNSRRQ